MSRRSEDKCLGSESLSRGGNSFVQDSFVFVPNSTV